MNANEMRKTFEEFSSMMDINKESMEMVLNRISILLYKRYISLIEAGFKEEQAFEIIKTRGLT